MEAHKPPLEAPGSPLGAHGSPREAPGSPMESPMETNGHPRGPWKPSHGSPLEINGSPRKAHRSPRGAQGSPNFPHGSPRGVLETLLWLSPLEYISHGCSPRNGRCGCGSPRWGEPWPAFWQRRFSRFCFVCLLRVFLFLCCALELLTPLG